MHRNVSAILTALTGATAMIGAALPSSQAFAQSQSVSEQASADSDEIVVTARLRSEQSIDVPVVVNAFTGEQLARAGVSNLSELARLTPQLTSEVNIGSFGGFNAMRGVTSPTSNQAVDPAVLVFVNGVPVGTGGANRLGVFDLGQVEVLKGPQALFFGRNASGGIISMVSAEPRSEFETMLQAEYAFDAEERVLNGVISGAFSESLLGRLAIRTVEQEGYLHNSAPGVRNRDAPHLEATTARGTLIFEPNSLLSVKFRATYDQTEDVGGQAYLQRMYCPSGNPTGAVIPGDTDCTLDDNFVRADLPLNLDTMFNEPLFPADGAPYSHWEQVLLSLDVSYQINDGVSLRSITGYYTQDTTYADNNTRGLPTLIPAGAVNRDIFSQEFRLASTDDDSAFDWMAGVFYQIDNLSDVEHVLRYAPATGVFTNNPRSEWEVEGETLSAFVQGSVRFLDDFRLSAGVRYTDETKEQEVNLSDKFRPSRHFTDLSPEVTLSYQPWDDANFFVSYREGYKSGSFQVSSLSFLAPIANPSVTVIDNSYGAEFVHGFEAGFKLALFNRALRLDAAAYRFDYEDLQVSSFNPLLSTNVISNAAGSRVQGAEVSINYRPQAVPELRVFSTIAYNDGRYTQFQGACFVGQTLAQGCTIDGPDAGTVPDLQDFSGRVLMKAPRWSGNLGFTYDREFGNGLVLGLNGTAVYQSTSFVALEEAPWGTRPDMVLYDAGVSIASANDSWRLALLGRNLSDERYAFHAIQEGGTGNAASTGTAVGVPADYIGYASRGREIRLQLTVRPNLLF